MNFLLSSSNRWFSGANSAVVVRVPQMLSSSTPNSGLVAGWPGAAIAWLSCGQVPNWPRHQPLVRKKKKKGETRTRGVYLEISAFVTPHEKPELILHVRDDGGLDRDEQILLLARILEDDGKGVVNVALDATIRPQEAGH